MPKQHGEEKRRMDNMGIKKKRKVREVWKDKVITTHRVERGNVSSERRASNL